MNPFSDYLTSINKTKRDIVREEGSQYNPEKDYPAYIFNKLLSYQPDAILLVAEINQHSGKIPKVMEYDFLREVLAPKPRWGKLAKPAKLDHIEQICLHYNVSKVKAEEILAVLGEKGIKNISKMWIKGGQS